jgi:lipopolysaccharide export system permease protein
VLTSDSARLNHDEQTGERYIVFSNGSRYIGRPGQLDYSVTEYETYGVRIDSRDDGANSKSPHAADIADLLRATDLPYAAELQWRLSMPLTAILLTLIAVTLIKASSNRGRYAGLLSAVIIYFTYSNLLAMARSLVKRGDLPVVLGLGWVHVAALLLLLGLYYYPQLLRWHARQRRLSPR